MYFLTDLDPDYTVKGSRDPLGLQVIWQGSGRLLIPHLSTVSNNIPDFQILAFAYACKKKFNISEQEFGAFFLRFEQLMAYARYQFDYLKGFNGVDKIRKIMSNNPKGFNIGLSPTEQILSNQKAYGIWGKYNRPFTEMKLSNNEALLEISLGKMGAIPSCNKRIKSFLEKSTNETNWVSKDELGEWQIIIEKPSGREYDLLTQSLLQDNCDNELLSQIQIINGLNKMSFFELIEFLKASSSHSEFQTILGRIKNIELTICPLNRIFRYLQTKSYWTFQEIEKDEFISSCRNRPETFGFDDLLLELSSLYQLSNIDLVKGLVSRNTEVSKKRNSAPWIQIDNNGVDINHFEGAFWDPNYQPEKHNDFNYFLDSFKKIYNELN